MQFAALSSIPTENPEHPQTSALQRTDQVYYAGKYMRLNLFILVPILFMFICSIPATGLALADANKYTDENRIVAKVNDKPIYFSQLKPVIGATQAKFKKYGADAVPDETIKRIQLEELERQIAFELLVQAGEKTFGNEIEHKVDEKITTKNANSPMGGQARKSAGANLSKDAYRNQVRRQLLVDEYLATRVDKDLKVPEAELKKYYEQNAKNFMEPESVRVSHILIKVPPKSKPEDVTRARKEIERIRAEIAGGKDFAEMARQHSSCASSQAGGDLGYIKHNYMPKEFDTVAFALKPGELSDVVTTRHGLHLIKTFDKKPERVPEFAKIKDFIEKHLLKEIQKKKVEEIVSELKRKAKVEIY
jgi:peptidyl-prolyl cis-trans isomerase C